MKRSPRALLPVAGAGCAGLGVVLIVIGTFLPWFRSGSAFRDSYQAIGLIRFYQLLDDSPLNLLLTVWVGLTPAITACVVAFALGLRRTAACAAGVLAVLTGTVAAVAVVQVGDGGALLGVAGTGPAVTLTGSALVLLGAVGVLAGRGSAAKTTGGTP